MAEESTIYFPLSSNTRSLLAGAPVRSVIRRIKVGALFHDHVVLQGGQWDRTAGPRGGMSWWTPPKAHGARWQTAQERGGAKGRLFSLGMKPDGAPSEAPFVAILNSEASISWRATFEPLHQSLPAEAADWLDIVPFQVPREAEEAAEPWILADNTDDQLARLIPDRIERETVIKSANCDLATAALAGVTVSVDLYHARVPRARLLRGDAQPAPGPMALEFLVPAVDDLDWRDIHDLRRHSGLREYRAILRDIEAAARTGATSSVAFERALNDEYQRALREANQQLLSSNFAERLLPILFGALVGLLVSDVALGLIAANTLSMATDALVSAANAPRWVTFDRDLQSRALRQRDADV